jgi:type I restriction enzyme, S subunit
MSFTANLDEIVAQNQNGLLGARPNWKRVRLREVATILNGFPFESAKFKKDRGTPLLRIRDVVRGETETFYDGEFDPAFLVNGGELVVGMDGDFNSARWRGEPALLNQRVCKITVDSARYSPRFLEYVLPGYLAAINAETPSVTVKHLSSRTISDIPLPDPPLDEQQRIVAEIEKQFTRLDAGVGSLKRVQTELKHYRASVLKAACEGRLVPTEAELARKENRSYETGEQLLQRILKDRREKWSGKDKYKEPRTPQPASTDELPEGWTWASWDQVGFSQNGRPFKSVEYQLSGFKLLRPGNLHMSGKVVWTSDNTRYVPQHRADENHDLIVCGRELVMNLTAQSLRDEFLGRVCLTTEGEECLLNQRLARLTPIIISPEFALYLLKAWRFRRFVDGLNTGSLIQHMFTSQLAQFTFPLPPLPEQKRIASKLSELLSISDNIRTIAEAAVNRGRGLRDAILHQAFEVN